jgi:hypothetical protein
MWSSAKQNGRSRKLGSDQTWKEGGRPGNKKDYMTGKIKNRNTIYRKIYKNKK